MKNLRPLAAIMAAAVLASCGGKGDSSPTATEAVKVETAIVGEAAGSKLAKAESLGVKIIDEAEFNELIK